MQHQRLAARNVREGHLYRLIPRRSLTFSTLTGQQTQLSTGEILLGVTVLTIITASKTAPALYELAATLDGEQKVFIVPQHKVILQKESMKEQR
ncbi:hypothetical protein KSD_49570 [Ktedonobacter sp. SOSP1-85]|uniref:hypothetical protein n=1 Tax=Ktedonobacter sp. SOSP1-85 TaxID=2778367 RepID=UPI0019156A4E|nr:hypothetical protein [Ktedonobacter sp. SOSP1-85]GHO77186.1 hypothetical protein KSD_49570 [Ktedonobacter sp. SOSP1-85]